jgi:hypothetical protein
MHDVIHAAIAAQRVRDLVETAEVERAARKPRRDCADRDSSVPVAAPAQAVPGDSWLTALLRLRPWLH